MYVSSLIKLDEQLQGINELVNSMYSDLEKNDDKEEYPFSILKLGLITWKERVFDKS